MDFHFLVWTTLNSIIRLLSLLLLLSSSVCKKTLFTLQSLMAFSCYNSSIHSGSTPVLLLGISFNKFHVSAITLLRHIYQIPYNTQDISTKETNHFQDLQLTLFNLPRQFSLSLAQVLFMWTIILIEKMLLLLI